MMMMMMMQVGCGGRADPRGCGRDPARAEQSDQRAGGPRPLQRRQEQPLRAHGVLKVRSHLSVDMAEIRMFV